MQMGTAGAVSFAHPVAPVAVVVAEVVTPEVEPVVDDTVDLLEEETLLDVEPPVCGP